jgi:tRNA-specific 2-thiouridylase
MTPGAAFKKIVFPVGNLQKSEVRDIAQKHFHDLNVVTKKESMGICFIGRRDFSQFLGSYFELMRGNFVDHDTNQVVGTHEGKEAFTIGQGAKIGGVRSYGARYFVLGKSESSGDVYVVNNKMHHKLFSSSALLSSTNMSWIAGEIPRELLTSGVLNCECRLRHRQPLRRCEVRFVAARNICNEGIDLACLQKEDFILEVRFLDATERAVCPGQVLALYAGDECLGGGPILQAMPVIRFL